MGNTTWRSCSVEELRKVVDSLRTISQYVRVVDPVTTSVILINPEGALIEERNTCFRVWGKDSRCCSCTSLCALNDQMTAFKEESRGQQQFHIQSVPITVHCENGETKQLVLEIGNILSSKRASKRPCVLIVEDQNVIRTFLKKTISDLYDCVEAENGVEALKILKNSYDAIDAILLDMIMPVMDGFETLDALARDMRFSDIPVLAITAAEKGSEAEKKCLQLGAWDFVSKPVDPMVLRMRLSNTINHSRTALHADALKELDQLTGLFNRNKFFKEMRKFVDQTDEPMVLLRIDIDRFRIFNSYFGEEEGNRLLRFMAQGLRAISAKMAPSVFGRIEADVFGFCVSYSEASVQEITDEVVSMLKKYNAAYYLEPSIGMYRIADKSMSVEAMYTCASLAADSCKERYMTYLAVYDPKMSQEMSESQEIMNEAQHALDEEQFVVYLQPKYNINTNQPYGAEALVRWKHPSRGLIAPGKFIPIFEANGFVGKLDYYMWEHVCRLLRKWMDAGMDPAPISVNVSRANLYNPDFADVVTKLIEKYRLSTNMLNLEITESAYMENPELMVQTVKKLQQRGFVIMMDDFGSGYSSLNALKDIPVDVLKIDMNFLHEGSSDGRGERILASIVRMAGWLDLPVIVEGVETKNQRDFLESIGCGYIQGFYYAKPMPVESYEFLLSDPKIAQVPAVTQSNTDAVDAIWDTSPEIEEVFEQVPDPVAVYEFAKGSAALMRVNRAFTNLFGPTKPAEDFSTLFRRNVLDEKLAELQYAMKVAAGRKEPVECNFLLMGANEKNRFIRMKLQLLQTSREANIIIATFRDITAQNALQEQLAALCRENAGKEESILVVDDSEVSRSVLREIFRKQYEILEASNGKEAQKILEQNTHGIVAILLDMVMPVMDGTQFLKWKKAMPTAEDIPVVVISAEKSENMQLQMLQLGVNDFVTKPFVPEMVERRVNNVLEYSSRFHELVREYRQQAQSR